MALPDKLIQPFQLIFLKQRKKIIAGIMTIFLILNVVMILIPVGQDFYELSIEVDSLKEQLQNVAHDQDQKDRMHQAFRWSKTRLVLDEYLIAQGDIAQYLESLTDLAEKSGVRLVSMEPIDSDETTEEGNNYLFVYFKLTASASYHNAGGFIASLESNPFFIEVANLEITGSKTAGEHKFEMTIRMLQDKGADKAS